MNRFLTMPILYALAGLLALSAVFNLAQVLSNAKLKTEIANAQTALATQKASIATEREAFATAARAAEQRHTSEMSRIDQETREKNAHDKATNDRLVADLRAGTVRLRQHWQAALSTANLAATVGTASGTDGAPADVADSIGRIFAGARASDAQVTGLQQVVLSMQDTCSDGAVIRADRK